MKTLVLSLILALGVTVTLQAQDTKPAPNAKSPDTFTVKDFKPEDQTKIQDLSKSVADIQKDIELAQTKIALAQAQLTRVNEVQLPQLEQALRDAYKLPKDKWDWNLQTLTFTKKKD